MAHFTLHYVLFSMTKLINPHMLLTESYRLIWSSSPSSEENEFIHNRTSPNNNYRLNWSNELQNNEINHTEYLSYVETASNSKFIFIHLSIYLIAISTYIGSCLKMLKQVDKGNNHRKYLVNSFGMAILIKIIYIYFSVALAYKKIESSSTILKIIYSIFVIALMNGSQWALSNIGTLSDMLALDYCIQHSKPSGVHHHFINYLMFGTFSLAIMSISLCEGYVIKSLIGSQNLKFTNLVLTVTLLSLTLEFIGLLMLTHNNSEEHLKEDKKDKLKDNKRQLKFPRKLKLALENSHIDDYSTSKEVYSLDDNSSKFPDIISRQVDQVSRAMDEDEVDLFYIRSIPSLIQNKIEENIAFQNTKDAFDRNKFSLYEDFCFKSNTKNLSFQLENNCNQIDTNSDDNKEKFFIQMSVFEILISSDSEFIKQVVALSIIGATYQANQLCVLSEYTLYMIRESSRGFMNSSSSELENPLLNLIELHHRLNLTPLTPNVIWIELICLSYLAQCSARILSLHYVHSLITKFGVRDSLFFLLISCPLLFIQLALNYYLLQNKIFKLSNQNLIIIVICQLMFIQIQIGTLSAIVDYIINDLTLQFSQQVNNIRNGWSRSTMEEPKESVRCTVNGILSGSFYYVGSALMAALILLINLICGNYFRVYPKVSDDFLSFLSIVPISILLVLTAALYLRRKRLKNRKSI